MGEFDNLHQILLSLYDEMMPLCADMTGVAKGLPGWAHCSMWRCAYGSRLHEPKL